MTIILEGREFNSCCFLLGVRNYESGKEYKKNKKKFDLQFKKKVALKACANKRNLEGEKASDEWNERRKKWVKPSSQVGYKAMTVRDLFEDMKTEPSNAKDVKSWVKFVGRCETLLEEVKFDIEGQ